MPTAAPSSSPRRRSGAAASDASQDPSGLSQRQRRERRYHDEQAAELAPDDLLVDESFEAPTALENRFVLEHFGDLEGRRVLDLGAGAGEASLYFASRGAEVVSLDISPLQLDVLQHAGRLRGETVRPLAAPAEELPFPDASFDLVYGYAALHHMDYPRVVDEVWRVLRPGGRVAFIEPLAYNPAIWVYRWIAAGVRTEDEFPFFARDVRRVAERFDGSGHAEFWLAAQAVFVWFWLGERVSPSADRYWKKVIRDGDRYRRLMGPLTAVDRWLARIPGVRYLAYNTVIYGERSATTAVRRVE